MTEGVGRGRGGMIIIFKLHGLAQENNDVTKSFTYISIFIYFTHTDIYTYTHTHAHTYVYPQKHTVTSFRITCCSAMDYFLKINLEE